MKNFNLKKKIYEKKIHLPFQPIIIIKEVPGNVIAKL